MRLKVVIAGSGFIAIKKHLPSWKKMHRHAQVVGLCDLNSQQAKKLARQFNIPIVGPDLEEILKKTNADIVDICTPPRSHASLAIKALKGGAHVLIEKPMAMNVDECDEIISVSTQMSRKVCVVHSDLFYPALLEARKKVDGGQIGDFTGMRIFLSTPVNYMTSKPDHWAHKLDGGVVGETGPHATYLTLAFLKSIRGVQVYAKKIFPQYTWSPFEDYRINLIGEKFMSSVVLTYTTNQWGALIEIWGTKGMIKIDLESQNLIPYQRTQLTPLTVGVSSLREAIDIMKSTCVIGAKKIFGRYESAHTELIRKFCQSIEEDKASPVPPEEGREAVKIMQLISCQLSKIQSD